MNIQAVMMMKNDINRMSFVLENFFKWNPDIPVTVYNCGGKSPIEEIKPFKNVTLIDYEDIWHKRGPNGIGSFDPRWFDLMFKHGLDKNYSHLLFLETDVLTTKKITLEPKYDMSGILNYCGKDEMVLYEFLKLPFAPHSSCGSTIFKREFFEKCKKNLDLVNLLYVRNPQNFFQDLVMTLLCRYSGCSYGYWEECSDLRGYHLPNGDSYKFIPTSDYSTTFVHSLKV